MQSRIKTGAAWLLAALLCAAPFEPAPAHPGKVDRYGCHRQVEAGKRHCHPERARERAPLFDPAKPPRPGDEGAFHGPLVRVGDGDSLHAKVQGVVMEFRLAEVDAPELAQPYGRQARAELAALVKGRELVLVPVDTDRYGRTVAHVWADGIYVNRALVERGGAWFYDAYARSDLLYRVEQAAREAHRGLWALRPEQRIEPWVWRREKR